MLEVVLVKDLSLTKDIFIKHCPVVLLDWTVVGLMFYFVFSIDSMETTELAILRTASTAAFTQKPPAKSLGRYINNTELSLGYFTFALDTPCSFSLL